MTKTINLQEVISELSAILAEDHPESGCGQNTCEVCLARKHKKNFAAASSFRSTFDASAKFDNLYGKAESILDRTAEKEFSELLNSVPYAKCSKCKKFVYEPDLSDYECSSCGTSLLGESKVVVNVKCFKDRREVIKILNENLAGGVLKPNASSVVQIVEKQNTEFLADDQLRIEATVVHHNSESLKEHFIGVQNSSVFAIKAVQITPIKKVA